MKTRYDVKTKIKNFKPGAKVLAFLPISNRHLQLKYFGLYTGCP